MTWIKYLPEMIVGGLIVALVLVALYFRSEYKDATKDAADAKAQASSLLIINEQQSQINATLANQRVLDNAAVEALNTKLDTINEATTAQAQAMADLEKASPDVKAYVDTPVPVGLKRVRN